MSSEEETKKIVKLMEQGCKDYLIKGLRLVHEVDGGSFRKGCDLQIFVDKNGVPVFVRRV